MRCLLSCAVGAFICVGCNNPNRNLLGDDGGTTSTLTYALSALPQLASGYRYEGWLKQSGGLVSVGKFDVLSDGSASPASIQVSKTAVASATAFVITVEPAADTNPAPSATKILAGPLTSTGATLKVSDPDAVGTDFGAASGKFMLSTPTTAADTTDSNEGIWWIDPSAGPGAFMAGLSLPTLPAGWKYEAWVENATEVVSTGKFSDPNAADDDGAGPAKGTDPPPPFPGDDFVNGTPRDLTSGYKAAVSVEPDPDPDGAPFAIKVLLSDTITSAAVYTGSATAPLATAANIAGTTLPQATVTIQ